MKIVVLDAHSLNSGGLDWTGLERLGTVTIYDHTDYEDIISRVGDAEIVFTNKTPIDRNIIDNTNIRYIGVLATGYDVIDIKCCIENDIAVCNVPSYSTDGVAQLTFALLLEIVNQAAKHSESVKNGDWCKSKHFSYTVSDLTELRGKTIGLIGFGCIGRAVAKIALAFNMNVIYYKPSGDCDFCGCKYVDLNDLLKNSDIISLHCPLTEETYEIINSASISKMKDNVIIINTARGRAVNERDLAEALNCGKVRYYGADVLYKEPPNKDNAIINAKNVIITPHIAWQSVETRERLLSTAISNLENYLNGKTKNNVAEKR